MRRSSSERSPARERWCIRAPASASTAASSSASASSSSSSSNSELECLHLSQLQCPRVCDASGSCNASTAPAACDHKLTADQRGSVQRAWRWQLSVLAWVARRPELDPARRRREHEQVHVVEHVLPRHVLAVARATEPTEDL